MTTPTAWTAEEAEALAELAKADPETRRDCFKVLRILTINLAPQPGQTVERGKRKSAK